MRAVTVDAFTVAMARLKTVQARSEFSLDEAPAPQRLAPDALALTVEPTDPDDDSFAGRFVLLHDPDGHDEWGGNFRAVIFIRADTEAEVVRDPMLAEVGWSWLTESLDLESAEAIALGGTVTWSSGESFGTLSDRAGENILEIRASWTPMCPGGDVQKVMDRHVAAWLRILEQAAGLPELPPGITSVHRRMHS
jgi:hypothetical protein